MEVIITDDLRNTKQRTTNTIQNLDNPVLKYDIHPWVFFGGAGIILLGVLMTLVMGEAASDILGGIQSWISTFAGWFFILVMNVVLLFCLVLMFSRFGALRIGGPDAEPEFSTIGWFSMLFSAGMGIGILFYGVANPCFICREPFYRARFRGQRPESHGYHVPASPAAPWAIYALVGLGLAFFGFSEGLPLSIRNVFFLCSAKNLWWSASLLTSGTESRLFGAATSLGLGVSRLTQACRISSTSRKTPWFRFCSSPASPP